MTRRRLIAMFITLTIAMVCLFIVGFASADESSALAQTPDVVGEYASILWSHRNVLEQELARARAEIQALKKKVLEIQKAEPSTNSGALKELPSTSLP